MYVAAAARLLCFKCLNYLITSSLVRNKAAVSSSQVAAWLDKVVKPVLANARKGGIQAQEQLVRRSLSKWAPQAAGVCCEEATAEITECDVHWRHLGLLVVAATKTTGQDSRDIQTHTTHPSLGVQLVIVTDAWPPVVYCVPACRTLWQTLQTCALSTA